MPKIKIVLVEYALDDDDYTKRILRSGITEWEEVTEEDLKYIQDNHYLVSHLIGGTAMVVKQDDAPVVTRIAEVKKYVADTLAKRAAEIEDAKKARDAKIAERKRKRELSKKTEAELYEELKAKFEPK